MTALVDVGLYPRLQAFGATDISACFNCGTCTAICPLSEQDATFPRRMIRYAQVGMTEELLSSKELWACYHCAECSDSCPTEAGPGEFMAAARRYAIASYDRTGLARTLVLRPALGALVAVLLAAFFALFMYTAHGPRDATSLVLFQFIPEALIHDVGLVVLAVTFLAGVLGIASMAGRISRREGEGWRTLFGSRAAIARTSRGLWRALAMDSLGQVRYRVDCEASEGAGSWYRRRWFLHAATMWGFLGLLAATVLDYGLAIAGVKATGTPVPPWYPVRLLGTVAGVLLLYGTSMLMVRRWRAEDRSVRHSEPADWTFLALLWITGATGFAVELSLYLPDAPAWGYWVFLLHVAVAMELVLLAPFMKFAHAFYRPVALFFLALARAPEPGPANNQGGLR